MNTVEFILTHPGSAHKDEFLACSTLLALHPVKVVRREPTPSDLANPAICVVDVGHSHQPELKNFDHHQLPRDAVPTSSLSLVLQHLGLYEDARQFCEWLEPAEWFDCRGPETTSKWLGTDRDTLNKLNSPIDTTLLRRFALTSELKRGEPLWEVMRMIGEDLINYISSLQARMLFISQHAQFWPLNVSGDSLEVLFLPRTEPLPDDPSMGLERFVEKQGSVGKVVGLVSPDRRGGGYGLSRYRDDPRLDFTRIASCADVHFAHARGFVAKTSATTTERLKELLKLAAGS